VGVPLIVIVLEAHTADTPAGNPEGTPIPLAPVVMMVTSVIAVFMQTVGFEEGVPAVLFGITFIVPVAFTVPQPPVRGME